MPWGLKRFQQARDVHFLTFSCYRWQAKFNERRACAVFLAALERVRISYGSCNYGYIVMPEHVHMLLNEPERDTLAKALQSLKQGLARQLALRAEEPFWQARYYDFNVWNEKKFLEKLRYIHRNPVKRGLCERPADWEWSSFRHYTCGETGGVEIKPQWTARKREQAGIFPTLKIRPPAKTPAQAELGRGTLES